MTPAQDSRPDSRSVAPRWPCADVNEKTHPILLMAYYKPVYALFHSAASSYARCAAVSSWPRLRPWMCCCRCCGSGCLRSRLLVAHSYQPPRLNVEKVAPLWPCVYEAGAGVMRSVWRSVAKSDRWRKRWIACRTLGQIQLGLFQALVWT